MNRQQEYAQQEAELIAKRNAEQTVEQFIKSVKQYNHSVASVQTLIAFNKWNAEQKAQILEALK